MTTSHRASQATLRDATVMKLEHWLDFAWNRLARWWDRQTPRMKLALAVAVLFAMASLLNLTAAGLGRATAARPAPVQTAATSTTSATAPTLTLEAAPTDPTKTWAVTNVWQGSGSRETEAFTVGAHWRVDWLFNPTQVGGTLQVFIYSADGRLLLNLAANTQKGGADTSFWAGPGTYFLKVNSSGGDWKLDVQDLR